jgi:hypothetical protein
MSPPTVHLAADPRPRHDVDAGTALGAQRTGRDECASPRDGGALTIFRPENLDYTETNAPLGR